MLSSLDMAPGPHSSLAAKRLTWCTAITKNGLTKIGAPPALDLTKVKSDKKVTDEEILKILEQPLSRNAGKSKSKKKKKKPAKKAAAAKDDDDDDDDSSDD